MSDPPSRPSRAEETAARRADRLRREGEALRDNLRRRKAQDRARQAPMESDSEPETQADS